MMVSSVFLRILLWIILLSCIQSVMNENVDLETLSEIQRFFHYSYQNENGQYAVAINVPKKQCQKGFNANVQPFLTHDPSDKVKPFIEHDSLAVYDGHELIAAGVHKDAHSEYLLMDNPHLTNLLKKKSDGCVVFYTLISPCIDICLKDKTVIAGLSELQNYQGIKAFVYTYVFEKDQNNTHLSEELKKIADKVPLYRCATKFCILCGEPGSNEVKEDCLKKELPVQHDNA